MADTDPKSATVDVNESSVPGIPGSGSSAHPTDAIPLPAHGFAILDELPEHDHTEVPAAEAITRAAVLLMSAAAEKLGLSPDGEPYPDLAGARPLITALAGLVAAAGDDLGPQYQPLHDGVKSLQGAFREASRYPDEPGAGPGEAYL